MKYIYTILVITFFTIISCEKKEVISDNIKDLQLQKSNLTV